MGLNKLQFLLQIFCNALGQQINFAKFLILSNKYASVQFKDSTCARLNMPSMGDSRSYLDIPFSLHKNQSILYRALLQKFYQKMTTWKNHLSKVGRLIKIQFVLQATPLHLMSYLKILKNICQSIEKEVRKFFWRTSQPKKFH